MMAVALNTAKAQRSTNRQILEQGNRADVDQVFATHDHGRAGLVASPVLQQAIVGDPFEYALAVLMAGSGVAELESLRQAVQVGVRFINNDRRQSRPFTQIPD